MKTKEIEVMWDGKKTKMKIKRMGWEEKNDFLEEYMEYKTEGNRTVLVPHPLKIRAGALRKCLIEAPFKTDPRSLNAIENPEDYKSLDVIWKEIESFNELGNEEKKN